jgi:hypothetical protein
MMVLLPDPLEPFRMSRVSLLDFSAAELSLLMSLSLDIRVTVAA